MENQLIIRTVTDLEVREGSLTPDQMEELAETTQHWQLAVGVSGLPIKVDAGVRRSHAHVHKSTDDHRCRGCHEHAVDELS